MLQSSLGKKKHIQSGALGKRRFVFLGRAFSGRPLIQKLRKSAAAGLTAAISSRHFA